MMGLSLECVIRTSQDIVASDIEDEKVMMSVEKGRYYGLDRVGSRVWDLLQGPARVSDVIDALLPEYDVDRRTCERDVLAFLEELYRDGIVEVER